MSNKLHIVGSAGRPEAIKHYLDLIDRRDYTSVEDAMSDAYHEFGLSHPSKPGQLINTKDMTTTLARLGLVHEEDRQELTDFGRDLVDVLIHNEQRFYDLLHFVYASAYHRNPSPERFISWSYYQITREYCKRAPVDFNDAKQEVVEAVLQSAETETAPGFDDHGTLSTKSINNYRRFIDELDPPVLQEGRFELREFVPSELVLAAIDLLYRTDFAGSREYGGLMSLSGVPAEALQTLCLVQEDVLSDVVEQAVKMDSRLSLKADYTMHVRLSEPVTIDDLA
ncbi:hypothetical protein [Halobacterium litoreum]|uniref:Uncharacterized protein n=1 Tax=Halobacterium litoreum TaxID=2039234 RepID=A0ABD5NEP8_9EURY|nr:hypothetical protein [Halobacterium litoreum]UHH13389.1 hypothetical protein LT972_14680 [Halobacterium litoreum]